MLRGRSEWAWSWWSCARLDRLGGIDRRRASLPRGGRPSVPPRRSLGRARGEAVVVKFEDVVGGGDQAPFAADGGSAAALEAFDRAVELDLTEHGSIVIWRCR